MSKSKALVVSSPKPLADPFARRALHIQRFHHMAMMHANQSVAAAILAGAELNAVKVALKKNASGCVFLEWFAANEETLGFSIRTKDKYMNLASEVKKDLPADIAPLLDFAPSELKPEQQKRLMLALAKKVKGETLNDLYLDYGIIKKPHGHALGKGKGKAKDTSSEAKEATPEGLIQDELWLPIVGGGDGSTDTIWAGIDKLAESWNTKTKVGNKTVALWEHTDRAKLSALVDHLEAGRATAIKKLDDMISLAKEALKRK